MDEAACRGCRALQLCVAELEAQVERLTRLLEPQQRAGKRQAAPDPITQTYDAPLPATCPGCGGLLDEAHIDQQ